MSDENAVVSRKEMVSWILQSFSALALAVGAAFFGNLTTKLGELSEAVHELKLNVAVMAKGQERIDRLELRLDKEETALKTHSEIDGHRVMDSRVTALERKNK